MKKPAALVLIASLAAGCGQSSGAGRPLDVAAAIVTAPIIAPIMFFAARRNDGGALHERVERARQNQSPPPLIDPRPAARSAATLKLALDRGAENESAYWENAHDATGHVAGGVTVLADGQADDGRYCREVLVETTVEGLPTDWRVRAFCREDDRWQEVEAVLLPR